MMRKPNQLKRMMVIGLFCLSTALVGVAAEVSPPNASTAASKSRQVLRRNGELAHLGTRRQTIDVGPS